MSKNKKDFAEEMEADAQRQKEEDEIKEALGADEDWEEVNPMTDEIHDFVEEKTLQGVYVNKQENVGKNNSNLYTIEKKGGEKIGVWGSNVLDSRFDGIMIGEEIKIIYLGKKQSEKSNRQYHDFKVFHKKIA